jgi:hypothetical protein
MTGLLFLITLFIVDLTTAQAQTLMRCAIVDTSKTPAVVVNAVEYPNDISGQAPPGMLAPMQAQCGGLFDIGWTFQSGTFTNPNPPPAPPAPPSMQLVSTSTPALNAFYPIDPTSQQKVQAISLYVAVNNKFPAGQTAQAWPDVNGTMHQFATTAQWQAFATAMADFVAAIDLGQTPAQPVTIP